MTGSGQHSWRLFAKAGCEVGKLRRGIMNLKLTGVVFCKTSAHTLGMFNKLFGTVHDTRLLKILKIFYGQNLEKTFSEEKLTSFDVRALLVKSLQHVLKHFSARLAYMRSKSCIFWG